MAEHAFDAVAVTITPEVAGDGLATIGLGRDDRQYAAHQQIFANSIAVISFVGEQSLGLGGRDRHQGINGSIVGGFSAGQDEAERASLIVTAGVDLARKAAA